MTQQRQPQSDDSWGWIILLVIVGVILWWYCTTYGCFGIVAPPPTPTPYPTNTPITRSHFPERHGISDLFSDNESSITFEEYTYITPPLRADECTVDCDGMSDCPCMRVLDTEMLESYIAAGEVYYALPSPYEWDDVITAIWVFPPGHTYDPPGVIEYQIPVQYQGKWQRGQKLPVLVWEKNKVWQDAGEAIVRDEYYAEGLIWHSSLYLLMKPVTQVTHIEGENFTVSIIPLDPDPEEDYQVRVVTRPPEPGISIWIEVSGTDGFYCTDAGITDENGSIIFPTPESDCDGGDGKLPGGEEDVIETLWVAAAELDREETFEFKF